MGAGISAIGNGIGSGVSKLGDALKPAFDRSADVAGTGNTAGELADLGYSARDLAKMGVAVGPSKLQQGLASGLKNGFDSMSQRPQGGPPAQFDLSPAPPVSPEYFSAPDYLSQLRRKPYMSDAPEMNNWTGLPSARPYMGGVNPSSFYGA